MTHVKPFIDPAAIKLSDCPSNVLPADTEIINVTDEEGEVTVKGFFYPKTGETHIQEVIHHSPQKNR